MSISGAEGRALVDELLKTRRTALRLELDLRIAGREQDAARVRRPARRLERQIGELVKSARQEWVGHAGPISHEVRQKNAELQRLGRRLRASVLIAENLASVATALDQACQIAAKLLGGETDSTGTRRLRPF